jgi:hypothetical protein
MNGWNNLEAMKPGKETGNKSLLLDSWFPDSILSPFVT